MHLALSTLFICTVSSLLSWSPQHTQAKCQGYIQFLFYCQRKLTPKLTFLCQKHLHLSFLVASRYRFQKLQFCHVYLLVFMHFKFIQHRVCSYPTTVFQQQNSVFFRKKKIPISSQLLCILFLYQMALICLDDFNVSSIKSAYYFIGVIIEKKMNVLGQCCECNPSKMAESTRIPEQEVNG